ncbi:hypothetical protein DSO57_1020888 [Entomophthora muscae]|uniref:Uncharacterized protein n=1 Tax=Entomophthora muscae TaxID=34485 RepID=A0ACC2RUN0_9FUNG|nr:hypothetical protein DSO57_1020888 [Entomophthora muscae]
MSYNLTPAFIQALQPKTEWPGFGNLIWGGPRRIGDPKYCRSGEECCFDVTWDIKHGWCAKLLANAAQQNHSKGLLPVIKKPLNSTAYSFTFKGPKRVQIYANPILIKRKYWISSSSWCIL